MTHLQRAKEIKLKYTKKYSAASDPALQKYVQDWIDQENDKEGYLPGLSPECNVTELTQIIKECGECTSHKGTCSINHILRNMAAVEQLLQLLDTDPVKDDILDFLEKNYDRYLMLKEYTTRICDEQWHQKLGV